MACALAGCAGEAAKQADEYTIMRRTAATSEELCAKARGIANLYKEDGNDAKFREWDQIAFVHCLDVKLGL